MTHYSASANRVMIKLTEVSQLRERIVVTDRLDLPDCLRSAGPFAPDRLRLSITLARRPLAPGRLRLLLAIIDHVAEKYVSS
jgi:hypothetical protein